MDYVVYEVTYKDEIVYIGSGSKTNKRYLHPISGKSNNVELNRLYFSDPENLKVTIIREGLTKEESLEMEKGFIQATEPMYNKVYTRRSNKGNRHKRFFE